MALNNYSDIKGKIASYLARSGMDTQISDAIVMFETQYNASEDNYFAEQTATPTTAANNPLVTLPTDFNEHVALSHPLLGNIDIVSLTALNARSGNGVGFPTVAALYPDNRLKLNPTPDAAYPLELVYEAKLASLSDAAPTNWMVRQFPFVYVYGPLMFMLDLIQDPERAALIGQRYVTFLGAISSKKTSKKLGGTPVMRIGAGKP